MRKRLTRSDCRTWGPGRSHPPLGQELLHERAAARDACREAPQSAAASCGRSSTSRWPDTCRCRRSPGARPWAARTSAGITRRPC